MFTYSVIKENCDVSIMMFVVKTHRKHKDVSRLDFFIINLLILGRALSAGLAIITTAFMML